MNVTERNLEGKPIILISMSKKQAQRLAEQLSAVQGITDTPKRDIISLNHKLVNGFAKGDETWYADTIRVSLEVEDDGNPTESGDIASHTNVQMQIDNYDWVEYDDYSVYQIPNDFWDDYDIWFWNSDNYFEFYSTA